MQMQNVARNVGNRDLAGALKNRRLQGLALAQVPFDVLDHHRAVVDQDADRKGEAAERHGVERLTHRRT